MKVALGVALVICLTAFADDTEQLHQEIILTGAAGVTGTAKLQIESENGIVNAGIEIQTHGLLPGTYRLSATRKSDGKTFELGTFTAEDDAGESDDDEIEFGTDAGLPLPDDLDPSDLAGIVIGMNDQVILSGDFTDEANTTTALFKAKVSVVAGEAEPRASGTAIIRTRTRRGFTTQRFKLNVKGVTPNATFLLKINGVDAGAVTTDPRGQLRLGSLPDGIEAGSILWMELNDPEGTNALTISF